MKSRRRPLVLIWLFGSALLLALPANALAYAQTYCGVVLNPATVCYSNGLHSWDFARAYYPGPPQHNVHVCTYLWNARTQQVRGGTVWCDYNNIEHAYGATSQADYNARAGLSGGNCCPHTVVGYAET